MSETQEAIIRQQTILMMARNNGKNNLVKRILKRFIKCISVDLGDIKNIHFDDDYFMNKEKRTK